MSSKKKKFEQQIQQNKINRVTNKNAKYNKKMSKSDENYIKGNYTKSVNQTVYGVKKNLAEGQKVHGYGDDYIDTKGMKRSRYVKKQNGENPYEAKYAYQTGKPKYVKGGTKADGTKYDGFYSNKRLLKDYEKESYKNTGTLNNKEYMPKQKYALMSSHKWDNAEKFSDHLNTKVWDGIETAKANQRKGKHISNALEYVKGGAKDVIFDPAMDFMKSIGAIGSYGLAGIAGVAEDSGNLAKAVADPKRDYKYYSQGRNNLKENLKANKEELDKTGFGKYMGSFLSEAKTRADEGQIRFLEDTGRHSDAIEYKKQIEENKKRDTNLLNVTGFVMDLLAPTIVEDKVVDVVKGLGKNTAKSFKELKNGTANLATGIVPEETAKLMANSKKYAGKGNKVTGASDDVFYSGKKGKTATDKLLDNQFEKTMDNVKDVVKKNPNTSNLGKFLDTLDNKPLKGTQRSIDGRTLNKKYTQTKDGYIPNLMNSVDEVDNIVKGKANGQYSMFGKDGSMNAYIDNIQNPYAKYEKVINKYGDDIDGLVNKIDSMSPHNAGATLDYLRKTRPEVYEQVVKGSDEITDMIESTTRRRGYETQQKIKDDNRYFNTKDVNTPKFSAEELAKQKYIKENNYKLLKDVFNPKFVDNVGNIKEREGLLRTGVKNFAQKVSTLSEGTLEEASVQIKNAKYLVDKGEIGAHEVSKMLNDLFFDGKDVVRRNVTPRHANQLLDYVDDMIVKQANGVLEEFDSLGNKIPVGEGARKISASLTDYRYDEKMSNLASHFGVKNKAELTDRYKELQTKKRVQPLNTDEFYEYKELGEKIAKWDDEYKKVKYMSDEYDDYAKKVYGKKDGTEGYKEALDELADKQAKIDATKGKENQIREAKHKSEIGSDPDLTASPRAQSLFYKNVDEYNHVSQNNVGGNIKNQIKPKDKIEYSKSIGLKYVNSKYGVQIPKDKQTFKNVYANKNVKSAVDNLLTLMNKEVKLTQGGKYGDEYAKIRLLVEDNVNYLDNLGVDRKVYFNELKNQKLKLIQSIQQDMQVGKNLNGTNPLNGIIKNTTKGINPLEMAHIKINGKALNNIDELTPDQLQWKYLMTEGAKTIDELFDIPNPKMLQRGDNLGSEISSMLGGKNNIQTLDDVNTNLNKTKNPFDEFLENKPNLNNLPTPAINELPNTPHFNNFISKLTGKVDGGVQEVMDIADNHIKVNEDYVHLPDLLKEQNNFPVDGDFDVLDLLKPNVDNDSQVNMLGYITGQKLDVDKSSLYKNKNKSQIKLPKIPSELDSGSFKQYADKLYELGINPYQKPPKTKPNNMPNEVYEYWNEFSNKVLSDDVSKKGINELKKIDEHIAKNSKEFVKPTKTTPDKSLENLNVYEDSMKNSTKTIHKNIDEYNKLNKHIDDVNIDDYMRSTNKMSKHKDNELYDMYKRWLNSYKKGLTVYNPGWHVQNFFQNKGQNYLALGADALLPQTEARNVLKQINGKGGKNGFIKSAKTNQVYSYDEIGKLAQELGVVDGLGEDVRSARGIFPRLENQIDNSSIMKWLGTNEQTARLNHFIKQIERGMSPEDASKSVNKYLFDYSKKNKVDDFMGDFVDPFWTFHKNNARLMYGSMFEHPGKINSIIRGTKGLENGIPEEQRQNEEFKYGKIQKPYANLTDSVNGDQYNYLYKQNMFPNVEDAIPFERDDIENKMNPLVRMLMQQSRGEGNFGNKIVEEGEKPGWNEITKEQRIKEVLMDLNPFMPNLVKTLGSEKNRQQKSDEDKQSQKITDKQILMDWINYITGNKGNWYRNLDL